MTGPPQTLKTLTESGVKAAYRARDIERALICGNGLQEYTVYPAVPLWLMSPGLRVYRKQDIWKFHGFIESVAMSDMPLGEQPTATMTIIAGNKE